MTPNTSVTARISSARQMHMAIQIQVVVVRFNGGGADYYVWHEAAVRVTRRAHYRQVLVA